MALDKSTVDIIARLARLHIDDHDVQKYGQELANILTLAEQMNEVDTDNVEPMTHPFDATLRLRDDAVTETNQRDKYQAIAPSAENGLYLVPKVID